MSARDRARSLSNPVGSPNEKSSIYMYVLLVVALAYVPRRKFVAVRHAYAWQAD
jgi:hypothetical protein